MTMVPSEPSALFFAEPPPQTGQIEDVTRWADQMFRNLAAFLRRPEAPGLVLSKIDSAMQPEFKAEDGLLIYAGAGVLGPQEGLYIRELGTWKKIAGT